MATWRCPHCGTLQADAARCFLCQRSATSCGTCVQFRGSVVGGVGYCAIGRSREPLTGDERRPCWTGAAEVPAGGLFDQPAPAAPTVGRAPAVEPALGRGRLVELHPGSRAGSPS